MLNSMNASILYSQRATLGAMANAGMGKRIRDLRERAGMTQAHLAQLIGVTRSAISQIESGLTKGVRPNHLLALAKHLKTPVESLVNGYPGAAPAADHSMQNTAPYLATLTEGEVELLQHLRTASADHAGRNELARQALSLLRALAGPSTEQRRPKH